MAKKDGCLVNFIAGLILFVAVGLLLYYFPWFSIAIIVLLVFVIPTIKKTVLLNRINSEGDRYHWPPEGQFEVDIVGESYYQKALAKIAGNPLNYSEFECLATLQLEDDNQYDSKAVAVWINGMMVGHLSKDDALSFRRRVARKEITGPFTTCNAKVIGGGTKGNGQKYSFGVKLDMKPFK